jgi:hypothetical protein
VWGCSLLTRPCTDSRSSANRAYGAGVAELARLRCAKMPCHNLLVSTGVLRPAYPTCLVQRPCESPPEGLDIACGATGSSRRARLIAVTFLPRSRSMAPQLLPSLRSCWHAHARRQPEVYRWPGLISHPSPWPVPIRPAPAPESECVLAWPDSPAGRLRHRGGAVDPLLCETAPPNGAGINQQAISRASRIMDSGLPTGLGALYQWSHGPVGWGWRRWWGAICQLR